MLTQKMTKETLIYFNLALQGSQDLSVWKEQVLATMKVFEVTLFALKDGGPAPLNLTMTKFRESPAAETELINNQLEKVVSLWLPIKANITKVLDSKSSDQTAMDYVVSNNVNLLTEMNTAVFQMQSQAERKVALMVKVQVMALAIGLTLVIMSILVIRAAVVNPLRALISAAEDMSRGNLKNEIIPSGLMEIRDLSSSLNRMRVSLIKMIAYLKKKSAA